MQTKVLILGAGPSGLTVANCLKKKGIYDFIVLEKEEVAGGLCRSVEVDGAPLDIGGGHFLDVRRPKVTEFLFQFMPKEEWNLFQRDSRIHIGSYLIQHPIEANIWQFPIDKQIEYLKSISIAGCNLGQKQPKLFIDWIRWKLGDKIAEDYMIPYNEKIFGSNLNKLGTYWLEKLPNVSFEETLRSCLEKKAFGSQPGHAEFFYPKEFGYGELWLRMAKNIENNIVYSSKVKKIVPSQKKVFTEKGEMYEAQCIISTIPWRSFEVIDENAQYVKARIDKLKYSSIEVKYINECLSTDAHWIYYPDPALPYHRILVRQNFVPKSRGYWTETNKERIDGSEIEKNSFSYMNEYAYPLNTIEKNETMQELIEWAKQYNIWCTGRWGEHQHYNSDLTVEKAMELAEKISL